MLYLLIRKMKENEVLENMEKLTKRQQDILDFIKLKVQEKGYPPSVREIGQAVGLASSSTVHGHLSRLEEKGYIRRDPTKPRAIEILGEDRMDTETQSVIQVPIVGKVTAGLPITAVESVENTSLFQLALSQEQIKCLCYVFLEIV